MCKWVYRQWRDAAWVSQGNLDKGIELLRHVVEEDPNSGTSVTQLQNPSEAYEQNLEICVKQFWEHPSLSQGCIARNAPGIVVSAASEMKNPD